MIIDLHGLSHHAAVKEVEDRLIQASNKGSFDAEIITGKSVVMKRIIVQKVLDEWGFDYLEFPDNVGTIYVSYTQL